MRPNGVTLYEGPSLIGGRPIVCVATNLRRKSENGKTGSVVQTYILPDEKLSPLQAALSGLDESVCGTCVHRPKPGLTRKRKLGSCYVNLVGGGNEVYLAYLRGAYPVFRPEVHERQFKGKVLRIGAYGDPAAVPLSVWKYLTGIVRHHVGYTHEWRVCDPGYARYVMASCETVSDRAHARKLGYRTFRVRLSGEPLQEDEFSCPASEEAGKRLTCAQCKACSGSKTSPRAVSPSIVVHGLHWKKSQYTRTRKRGRISLI